MEYVITILALYPIHVLKWSSRRVEDPMILNLSYKHSNVRGV